MGLINTNAAATTPAFEAEDKTAAAVFANAPQVSDAAPAAPAEAQVNPAPAAEQAPATPEAAVAVVAPNATAVAVVPPAFAISEGMKNAMVVDFNTFPQITASNGNFVERETKTLLGDTVNFELLSFQDSFVVDPGDDQAPKELVRYSDDGVVCSDGTPVREHLEFLKAGGYSKATLKERSVIVAEVISCSKTSKYDGELMQFDLSPMSRVQWVRYLANSVNTLRKARKTVEQLKNITATTEVATGGNGKQYTKATFAATAVAA